MAQEQQGRDHIFHSSGIRPQGGMHLIIDYPNCKIQYSVYDENKINQILTILENHVVDPPKCPVGDLILQNDDIIIEGQSVSGDIIKS